MKFNKDECLTINYRTHQIRLDSWSLSLSNQKVTCVFQWNIMINYFSTHQIIMWKGSQGKIEDPSKNLLFKFICQTAKKYKKKVMREKENGKKLYLTVEWSLPSKLMIIFLSLVIFLFKNLLCVSSSLLNLCLAVKNCFFYTVVREFAEKNRELNNFLCVIVDFKSNELNNNFSWPIIKEKLIIMKREGFCVNLSFMCVKRWLDFKIKMWKLD